MRLLRAAVFTAVCVVLAAAGHTMASGRTVPAWALAFGWLAVFAVVAPLAGRERTLPGIAALLAVGQVALHAVFNIGQICAASALPSGAAGAAGPSGLAGSGAAGSSPSGLMAVAARLVCGNNGPRLTPSAARQVVVRAGLDPAALGAQLHLPGTDLTGARSAAASGLAGMPGMPGMPSMAGVPHVTGVPGGGRPAMAVAMTMCSVPMLLGHLLAALVAGWLLRRGEAALWRLVRLSVRGAASLTDRSGLSPATLRLAYALLSALSAGVPYAWRRIRCVTRGAAVRHRTVWLRHGLARRGPPSVVLAA